MCQFKECNVKSGYMYILQNVYYIHNLHTYIVNSVCVCVCVVRTFKIYSQNKLESLEEKDKFLEA